MQFQFNPNKQAIGPLTSVSWGHCFHAIFWQKLLPLMFFVRTTGSPQTASRSIKAKKKAEGKSWWVSLTRLKWEGAKNRETGGTLSFRPGPNLGRLGSLLSSPLTPSKGHPIVHGSSLGQTVNASSNLFWAIRSVKWVQRVCAYFNF